MILKLYRGPISKLAVLNGHDFHTIKSYKGHDSANKVGAVTGSVLCTLFDEALYLYQIFFYGKIVCFFVEFFGDFRCGALLFMVIHVIYKYGNK